MFPSWVMLVPVPFNESKKSLIYNYNIKLISYFCIKFTIPMKGKIIWIIICAIISLVYAIVCFVDGSYYLSLFGLLLLGSNVHDYITLKKK